jgi:hypothetical protein
VRLQILNFAASAELKRRQAGLQIYKKYRQPAGDISKK